MTEQELFNFLSKNLTIEVNTSSDYYGSKSITIELYLKNPATGKPELISTGYDSI